MLNAFPAASATVTFSAAGAATAGSHGSSVTRLADAAAIPTRSTWRPTSAIIASTAARACLAVFDGGDQAEVP